MTYLYYGIHGQVVSIDPSSISFVATANGRSYRVSWPATQAPTSYGQSVHMMAPTTISRTLGQIGYLFIEATAVRSAVMPIASRYAFWQQPHFIQYVRVSSISGTIVTVTTNDRRTYRADFTDPAQVNTLTNQAPPGPPATTSYVPIATDAQGVALAGASGYVAWTSDFVTNNNNTAGLQKWPDGLAAAQTAQWRQAMSDAAALAGVSAAAVTYPKKSYVRAYAADCINDVVTPKLLVRKVTVTPNGGNPETWQTVDQDPNQQCANPNWNGKANLKSIGSDFDLLVEWIVDSGEFVKK